MLYAGVSGRTAGVERIGVIGAGVIGTGVAHLFAQTGHDVVLIDRDPEQLAKARSAIARDARLFALVTKTPPGDPLARLACETDPGALAGCGAVVENITENWGLKQDLHRALDGILRNDALLAINTSAIPIARLAALGRCPERTIGMHFKTPVPLMPTVELIRATHTSEATIAAARALLAQAGRETILVNDSPGFVTNRVMMLMVNEAMFLLHEGVASAQEIDRLFKTCFGHKMGPLETADLIGLDTVLRSLEVIQDEFGDDKYRPCPLLKTKVYAGHCGRKNGRGFHVYDS
jgi:3-hydroxybutyryl-CoA dehydrogenase